jgi:hypothetical protein
MPCLIDLRHGLLAYNALDERLKPFVGLFTPVLFEEEVERVAQHVVETLLLRNSLALTEVMQDTGATEEAVRKAFERLAGTGSYKAEEIERVGRVIVPV